MRILITGFEPFDNLTSNPSEEVARELAKNPPAGFELHSVILPVDHRRGPEELLRAFDLHQPEAVICLGEAGGRAGLSIERLAVNLVDDRIADNSGEKWVDQPVVPGGPAAYFASLPIRSMQQAILEAGVPVELSLSAGTFLCNQILYVTLHHIATHYRSKVIPAGFIHLPRLPEQAALMLARGDTGVMPSMDLETQVRGLEAGLKALIR
jgi:pyroglutamyl-peptidase